MSLLQKSVKVSFRQGFWAGIQALRFLAPGWKHAGVTEFETFARGYNMIKKPLGASTSPRVSSVHPTYPSPATSVSRVPSRMGSSIPTPDVA